MDGLDEAIAALAAEAPLFAVLALAALLGLRHATDPDHLAAVATLNAGDRNRGARRSGVLGLAWGAGHAVALLAAGLPVLLLGAHLPANVERGAEFGVGLVIVALAVRLLVRWRRERLHVHRHAHDGGDPHAHVHTHADSAAHAHPHRPRTPAAAFGIGLLHGVAGSAAVCILLVASIGSPATAAIALAVLGIGTALTMAVLSTGLGIALGRASGIRTLAAATPCLAVASLAFGTWFALGALAV